MAIVTPIPIPPAPELPQSTNPTSFDALADAYVAWQSEVMAPGIDAQAEATYQNALDAEQSATTATNAAMSASGSASDAAGQASTASTAAVSASNAASAASSDALTASAAANSASSDALQTGEDRQAVAAMLDSIAGGPVYSVNGQTGAVVLDIGTNARGNRTISASDPAGGVDGDIHYKVE